MLTQEAIFIATIKGTSLVIKTRPFLKNSTGSLNHDSLNGCLIHPGFRALNFGRQLHY